MTAEEHAHVQQLEGKVKRYRSRIVELKTEIEQLRAALAAEPPPRLTAEDYENLALPALQERLMERHVYGSEVLCETCAAVFCPHGEQLHFHHDGCPACAAEPPPPLAPPRREDR